MMLFAFNIALAATLAAIVGLVAERLCPRRAVAVRHGVLFVCLIVIAAAPLLAYVAQVTGTGVLQTPPPTHAIVAAESSMTVPKIISKRPLTAPSHERHTTQTPATRLNTVNWAAILNLATYILLAAWAAGTFFKLTQLFRSWTLLRRLAGTAEQVGDDVRRLANAAARRLGLRPSPEVSWCDLAASPLVMGWLRPRVLLPRTAASLSADELEAVLLHEIAHVARRDQWAGLLAALVQAAFWWCVPAVLLIRRLGDWREQLCDAQVVQCQGHGLNLATALLSVCEWSMRGRSAFAGAAALGAAGSSGRALRNRIQSLADKEYPSMIHTNFVTRLAVGALGLFIAGAVTVVNVRTTQAAPAAPAAEPSATAKMLSAPDFWQKTGAMFRHEFDKATTSDLEKIADSPDRPLLRLRAFKLLCDQAGHSRPNPDFNEADNTRAVTAAFEYLEAHLGDAEIVKYAPEQGFTHMTVSRMNGDGASLWVLIETAGGRGHFNGGLNIQVDFKSAAVTSVKQWGDVRAAAGKP
jgi:beta-lactamase regulating signal transducer with metallopeptidase domain